MASVDKIIQKMKNQPNGISPQEADKVLTKSFDDLFFAFLKVSMPVLLWRPKKRAFRLINMPCTG